MLHLLLLSTQYCLRFSNESLDFKEIIDQQWNISNPHLWKSLESWPNNLWTVTAKTDLDKILYFCNPTKEKFFNYQLELFKSFNASYNNIKDISWPELTSFEDFKSLPNLIQTEILNESDLACQIEYILSPKVYIWVYTDFNSQNELSFYKKANFYYNRANKEKIKDYTNYIDVWNNTMVDKNAVYFLNNTLIQIKLQDIVNSPKSLVNCGLINELHQTQLDLIDHWKSLHCTDLLIKIGINN